MGSQSRKEGGNNVEEGTKKNESQERAKKNIHTFSRKPLILLRVLVDYIFT